MQYVSVSEYGERFAHNGPERKINVYFDELTALMSDRLFASLAVYRSLTVPHSAFFGYTLNAKGRWNNTQYLSSK